MNTRREGDTIVIDGDYQHRAMNSENLVQRFWHHSKTMLINEALPPAPGDFVLDVGCGSGVITSFLGQKARRVIGVDANPRAVDYARAHFSSERVSFVQSLVDEGLQFDEPANKIYCLEVIEHIYHDQGVKMLSSFRRLLAPGGRVFLTTPNYVSLWPIIEWGLDRFTEAAQMKDHQHVMHYTPGKLREVCREAGFEVERLFTVCSIAPWVAPLSWKFALRMHQLERSVPVLPGPIIVCTMRAAP